MEHGTSRSFVVTHPDDIGQVKRVEFYWEYDMDVLQPRSICFFWCNDHLYVSSIGVTEAEEDGNRGYDDHIHKSKIIILTYIFGLQSCHFKKKKP